ncbi:MAG: M56 family metallopeptidase, partial [Acidobacteria bacterium]|nr:M56 family metallopeptidase [Acidobacteriota bacterium]
MNTPQAVQLLFGASLVFIAALSAVVLLRKASAAVRHLAAALGLLGVLVLPFVPVPASLRLPLLPAEQVRRAERPEPRQMREEPVARPQAEPRLAERASVPAPRKVESAAPARREAAPLSVPVPALAAPAVSPEAAGASAAPWARFGSAELLAVGLWLLGAVVVLLRFGLGVVRLRRLLSRATPAGTELRMDAGKAARRLGLTREVPVLTSTEAFVPMAAGVFSPVLLLPEAAETWPAERREAVLLHELAHVSRNDCAWQAVATCARALYWPLPFVWALEKSLRRDAERAADDLALSSGTRASEYAEALVFAVRAARRSSLAPAFGMGKPSELEGRVRAILDPGQRRGTSRPVVAGAALFALLVVAFAGAVTPFEAEGRPAVPVDHAGHHGGDAPVDEDVHEAVHEAVHTAREVARQATRTAVREAVRARDSEAVNESVREAVREAAIEAELNAKRLGMSAEVQRAMARAAQEAAYAGERMSVETRRAL